MLIADSSSFHGIQYDLNDTSRQNIMHFFPSISWKSYTVPLPSLFFVHMKMSFAFDFVHVKVSFARDLWNPFMTLK